MHISINYDGDMYVILFENDATAETGEISFTGGLNNLKNLAEETDNRPLIFEKADLTWPKKLRLNILNG